MSQAENLLNLRTANPSTEPHIVIGENRYITVPEELKRIAVQFDHNVETVTFDCPRYWDEHDMSQMAIYIVYRRPDGEKKRIIVNNVTVDGEDPNIIHFEWTISRHVTMVIGTVDFIVCITKNDDRGVEIKHWNSEICSALRISQGLEADDVIDDTEVYDSKTYTDVKFNELKNYCYTQIAESVYTLPEIKDDVINTVDTWSSSKINSELDGKVNSSGYSANKLLGTDSRGNVVEKETFTIPIATDTTIGGIKVSAKTDLETVEVKMGTDNKLYVPAGGGDVDVDAELREYYTTTKQNIRESIEFKGVTVLDTDSFNLYADKIREIPSSVIPTETIPEPTQIVAIGLQETNGIKLTWSDTNASGYLVKRRIGDVPVSTSDGETVYNGSNLEYTDTNVNKNTTYCYRIFPYNYKNQFNSVLNRQTATILYKDRSGQVLVDSLNDDDVIKFGFYENTVLSWKVKDTYTKKDGYISLACEQNLGGIIFDTPENAADNPNPVTNRKNQGNNRWSVSNIRQILNSDVVKNEWYTPQHDYDVAPNYVSSKNGFLYEFTEYEKNVLYQKENICVLDTNDGGGSETVLDKIWVPSTFEIGAEIPLPFENDHVFTGFSDATSRTYQSNWWTRTINNATSSTPNTASSVRYVGSSGGLSSFSANNGYVAARPFCSILTSAYVRWSDSDGAYIFADDNLRNP